MKRALLLLPLLALPALAQGEGGAFANPVVMVIVLGAMALTPFVLIMLTSFVKVAVVLSILRSAIGAQQVPPNQVVTGLAFVLTLFIMAPVASQMYQAAGSVSQTKDIFSEASVKSIYNAAQKGKEPLRRFLARHSHDKDRILFMEMAARLDASNAEPAKVVVAQTPAPPQTPTPAQPQAPTVALAAPPANPPATPPAAQPAPEPKPAPEAAPAPPRVDKDAFSILIPSFVTSQLKEAFEVGFLIFVPFLIVDMVVANILLSMGMQMLSPVVVSLPFKLLLFVLVDGWYLVVKGLVLSYS